MNKRSWLTQRKITNSEKSKDIEPFLVRWCFQRTLVPSFFLSFFLLSSSSFCLFCILPNYMWLISSNLSTTTIMSSTTTTGAHSVRWGVRRCAWVCAGMRGCVWDDFSEYLLENRVPTSADFNTYPIRIFY